MQGWGATDTASVDGDQALAPNPAAHTAISPAAVVPARTWARILRRDDKVRAAGDAQEQMDVKVTTTLRVFAIALGVVAALLAAAALILPRAIDPNLYRDRIAAWVEQRTGRALTIDGEIGWSVFPWLGIELGKVSLANAAGFGDEPLVQADAVQVRVKLLPLLRKDVEMSTVVLDGLRLHLAKARDGRTNWADVVPVAADPVRGPKTTAPPAAPSAAGAVVIGGLQVKDARLVWDDRTRGVRYVVDQLNLRTEAIRGDHPVGVELSFAAAATQPAIEANVRVTTQVVPTRGFTRVDLRDLRADVTAHGKALPRDGIEAKFGAQIAYAADQRSVAIDALDLQVSGLRVHGRAHGRDVGGAAPRLEGALQIDPFAPRELLQRLQLAPPAGSDPQAPRKAQGAGEFVLTSTSAQLRKLQLHIDDSVVTGGVDVDDFSRPSTRFQLAVDKLDLDRYLPPRRPQDANTADAPRAGGDGSAAADKATQAPPLLPVETLRRLRINGTLHVGQLKAYQIRSNAVAVTAVAENGLMRLAPARARLYDGGYDGNIRIDVRGTQPQFALDERLSGVQIGALLKDMQGEARVTGKADVALTLTAEGDRIPALRQSLNGTARFALADGVVKGMDVLGEIRKAYAVLRGKAPPQVTDATEFSAVSGTATIAAGVVNNPDLQGRSPLLQLQGAGSANLVTDALDYRLTATLVDVLEGKGELTGRPIPIRISGRLGQPKVAVDLQQLFKQEVRKRVEEKIQEKLRDDLEGGLKGLFGR